MGDYKYSLLNILIFDFLIDFKKILLLFITLVTMK